MGNGRASHGLAVPFLYEDKKMANGWTNRGKYNALDAVFRATTLPTNYYIALTTDAPTEDTNLMSDLTQIATGNGYVDGGFTLSKNSTDFDVLTETDSSTDVALIEVKDVAWTASGGTIPASGDGARYAVLTGHHGTVANREVWAYWDLSSARTVSDTQVLTLQNCQLKLTEPA